jgi:hypothetical protein
MGLQAAVHLGHMPWALTKEEEELPIIFLVVSSYECPRQSLFANI